jgi:IS5 family transposase
VLERLNATVDFELFRPELEKSALRADGTKGGRLAFNHVLMFKVLVLQAMNGIGDEQAEYFLRDRLTWKRFLGLGLGDIVPDANTIWLFREQLTKAHAIKRLFERFDAALRKAGYLAMSGQLIDASIVAAPKQRNNDGEKPRLRTAGPTVKKTIRPLGIEPMHPIPQVLTVHAANARRRRPIHPVVNRRNRQKTPDLSRIFQAARQRSNLACRIVITQTKRIPHNIPSLLGQGIESHYILFGNPHHESKAQADGISR